MPYLYKATPVHAFIDKTLHLLSPVWFQADRCAQLKCPLP